MFQSPRSGKFVSDKEISASFACFVQGFNPLDRGNLYQITSEKNTDRKLKKASFNPLDRGNLYQMRWDQVRNISDVSYYVSIP